jgi:hypothetical protein
MQTAENGTDDDAAVVDYRASKWRIFDPYRRQFVSSASYGGRRSAAVARAYSC